MSFTGSVEGGEGGKREGKVSKYRLSEFRIGSETDTCEM
jgi:hypothetical protein